jgi:uncharacterized protein YcgI (DUF1989 family)
MAISYVKFFPPTLLTTSDAVIYTVPAVPATSLLRNARVRLTNFTTTATTARVYAVPSAGSVSTTNTFFYDVTIPANDYIDVDVPILASGDQIQARAGTASSVNIQGIAGGLFS